MNLLALAGKTYEGTARGILYVFYEIMWKIIYGVLLLIDEITKLFYKVAGISISNGSVQNKNMFQQLLNQQTIGTWYLVFSGIALALVLVFTLIAVLRATVGSEEKKSMGPIIKNVGLAVLLLLILGPIVLVAISIASNLAILIASLGGNKTISISDMLVGNGGNLLEVYNATHATEFTSYRDLASGDFLYELIYEPVADTPALTFYWYIVLASSIIVLYNLIRIVIDIIKRIYNIVILYVASPFVISKMVVDDGVSFKAWQSKFIKEFVLFCTQIGTFMIFVALINVLNNIDFEGLAQTVTESEGLIGEGTEEVVEEVKQFSLLNGLGRTIVIVTSVMVTRSSADLLGEVFSGEKHKTDNLLESVLNKVSTRGTPVAKTKTITKNTTTTKRETVFVETGSSRNAGAFNEPPRQTTVNSHATINQTFNTTNKFSSTNNITSHAPSEGASRGSYASSDRPSPSSVYMNASKGVSASPSDGNWKMLDSTVSKAASSVAKEFNEASKQVNAASQSGNDAKIKESLASYTKAYEKEAEMMSKNYQEFEKKAMATMKSAVSEQTKSELKHISEEYRKAQNDYNKAASKMNNMNSGSMSTMDALRMKDRSDKQREKLMQASNRAAGFYQNQKKGE